MIRFPNPGSDPYNFIKIFTLTYTHLKDKEYFTLDDMTIALASENYISCRGFGGQMAVLQSNDKSKALQPLYNQCKMYSELYRSLGWFKSTRGQALKFSFTYIGEHVATAEDSMPLFKECLLGINYPNDVLNNNSQPIRPFYCILKCINALDGLLTKMEMIIGPMNIDDTNINDYNNTIDMIKKLRATDDYSNVKQKLTSLANTLKISTTTLDNYTRFPIAMLTACGWVEKITTKSVYPKSKTQNFIKITKEGKEILKYMEESIDIRHYKPINNTFKNIKSYDDLPIQKDKLIRYSLFKLLEKCQFDITNLPSEIINDFNYIHNHFSNKNIIFSPYQTLNSSVVDNALSLYITINNTTSSSKNTAPSTPTLKIPIPLSNTKTLLTLKNSTSNITVINSAQKELEALYQIHKSSKKIIKTFCKNHENDNQDIFYPLISDLFNLIGLNCKVSRKGENYQRFDALIIDEKYSIPIEIKSPSEEMHISTKAIRQALENKIILLSRQQYATQFETTSLAIGFKTPNDRSDVFRLIEDIKAIYNINISMLNLETLVTLAVHSLFNKKVITIDDLANSGGIINV